MNIKNIVKPIDSINRTISKIKQHSTEITIEKKTQFFHFHFRGSRSLYIVESDYAVLRRNDNGLILGVAHAPMIIGLTNENVLHNYSLSFPVNSMIYKIEFETFNKIIDKTCGWKDVAEILSYHLSLLLYRDHNLIGRTTYSLIRMLLISLHSFPEELRMTINTPKFIIDRTGLSRSAVMTILRELKKGGYITIKNGKLIRIENLPFKY